MIQRSSQFCHGTVPSEHSLPLGPTLDEHRLPPRSCVLHRLPLDGHRLPPKSNPRRTIQGFPKRAASEHRGPYKLRFIFNIYVIVVYFMCILFFIIYIYVLASILKDSRRYFVRVTGYTKFACKIIQIYIYIKTININKQQ